MKIMMIVLVCMVMQNSLHGMEELTKKSDLLMHNTMLAVLQKNTLTVEDKKKIKAMMLCQQSYIHADFIKAGLYNKFLSDDDDKVSLDSLSQEKK